MYNIVIDKTPPCKRSIERGDGLGDAQCKITVVTERKITTTAIAHVLDRVYFGTLIAASESDHPISEACLWRVAVFQVAI